MTTTKFQQIKRTVANYHKTAEGIFKSYNERIERARKRYSKQTFKTESATIWGEHSGTLTGHRDSAKEEIKELCDDIRQDFRKWVMRPISGDLLQTLNYIDKFGMKLTLPELEILSEETKNSFFGSRIFGEIAKKNGYFMVDIPDAGRFSEALKRVESNATFSVDAYAGTAENHFWGRDLCARWTYNGMDYGEYNIHHWLTAANFLDPKNNSVDYAERLFGERDIDIAFKVLPSEEKRIKKELESLPEDEAARKERINTLIDAEPDIVNKLKLMNDGTLDAIKNYIDTGDWYGRSETAAE